jgi:NAD(P) transhydrogenase subunit alpha
MPLSIAVARERAPGESRVALVPETAKKFAALGASLRMEQSAGAESHFLDTDYVDVGMVNGISEAYGNAGLILRVTPPSPEEIAALPEGSILIGLLKPFEDKARLDALNARKITAFSLELLPRISRAQSMDALSSQASCAGYQCGLIAAARCTKFFPMLTTAAGTIRPARVLVIGAGVAGLQAIATCKRLGAMVEAYDVRSAAREQIESLGAKFVDTGVSADGAGGYARDLTAEEKAQQTEKLAKAVALSDVVITTARHSGQEGTDHHHHRHDQPHEVRRDHRRYGGRIRRQLRADPARRARRGQ